MKKIIVLMALVPIVSFGQRTYLEEGDDYFEQRLYKEAIASYKKALEQKVVVNKGHMLERVAETYKNLFEYANAEEWYAKYLAYVDSPEPKHRLNYGEVLINNEKYDEAISILRKYVSNGGDKGKGQALIGVAEWAKNNQNYKFAFNVYQTNIETGSRSIGVAMYKNGLLYGQAQIKDFVNNTAFYDLAYIPAQNDTTFGAPSSLKGEINHKFYEGAPSLTADNKMLYYTGNATEVTKYRDKKREKKGIQISEEGINILKVFSVEYQDNKWVDLRELPFNSTSYDCTFPHISDDGQTLYFASNMPGGEGGFDLYRVTKENDTTWSDPENLGPRVNTPHDEMYPYLFEDSLYFSSRGLPGFGGTDIFAISLDKTGNGKPRNIGKPLNSSKDDFAFVVKRGENGRTGYFSSNRVGPNGYDHVFYFEEVLPEPEIVEVVDTAKTEPEPIDLAKTDTVKAEPPDPEPEKSTVLTYDKVYFDLDRSTLRDESIPTLDNMVAYLKHHSGVRAEVSAHTDCRAPDAYNMALSQRRANSVLNYLVKHGIDRKRLVPKGYGETKLVNKCADGVECSEEEHQKNRRVELKIL